MLFKKLSFIILLIMIVFNAAVGQNKHDKKVVIAVHKNLIEMVNELDAVATLEVYSKKWLKEWNENNEDKYAVAVEITKSRNDITNLVESGEIILLSISSIDYFRNLDLLKADPLYLAGNESNSFAKFYLIANKFSGIKDIGDIENRKVIFPPGVLNQISSIWANTIIYDEFNKNSRSVFSEIQVSTSTEQALLKVYFNLFDLCVIDKESFEIISEMNPQIEKDLVILKESEEYPHSVMILLNTKEERIIDFVRSNALELENETYGRQLLQLFKVHKIVPYDKSKMKTVNELYKKSLKVEE